MRRYAARAMRVRACVLRSACFMLRSAPCRMLRAYAATLYAQSERIFFHDGLR